MTEQKSDQQTERQVEWREPEEGFEFEPHTVVVTEMHQAEKLAICGLQASAFNGFVDASFYIGLGIHAGIKSGISAEGNVNMLQNLHQHRPVHLGEELTVKGYIKSITEVPRGKTVDTEVWFEGEDGTRAISASRLSLKPDPGRKNARGAGDRPAPVVQSPGELQEFDQYQLTPENVKNYSQEGNSIHYEMEAAKRAGFRAPIIGGGMGVHYLVYTLWRHYKPQSFELSIYFRRPIFWDDAFTVAADPVKNSWRAICLFREDKVLTEAKIESLQPEA
jgi:hydroxyacyl-ACP dehydratase HTD2-like protein with hotdog domain